MASDISTPHFALPFRFKDGLGGVSAVVNEQDSYEEIRDCVSAIVRYSKRDRPEAPDFGITPLEFEVEVDTERILEEVQRVEPRVQLIISSFRQSADETIETVIVGIVENQDASKMSTKGGSDV